MKKLLMIDCFGVLVGELAPIWFASHYEPDKAAELKRHFFEGADCGDKSIKQLIEDISVTLGIKKEDIISEWQSLFRINDELFAFLGALKKNSPNCDIILVSNAPQGLVEEIFIKYNLDKYFDDVFVSWKYKMAKPNPMFYQLCIRQMQSKYQEIYMIDDNKTNLDGIGKLGIIPIYYKDNESLIKKLSEVI